MVTPRQLRWAALQFALALNFLMVLAYGAITDWCFCSVCGVTNAPVPPVYGMRFIEMAALPAEYLLRGGMGLPVLVFVSTEAWCVAALIVLNVLALAARIRLSGPARQGAVPRLRLAPRDGVRPAFMVLLVGIVVAAGLTAGALYRQSWLRQADSAFATAMAAAAAGRPLPAGLTFSLRDHYGTEQALPAGRIVVHVDRRIAGDHFLDRFVVPRKYGGTLRLESGRRYDFTVYRDDDTAGWMIDVSPPSKRPLRVGW